MAAVIFFMSFLNSSIMAWIVVAKSVCVTGYEVKGSISNVVVSVEVGRPDCVFVEGEMMSRPRYSRCVPVSPRISYSSRTLGLYYRPNLGTMI